MFSTEPESPRFELRTEKTEFGPGFSYEVHRVWDTAKGRVYDSFQTRGLAEATVKALNAGEKTPERHAAEIWALHG